MAKEVEAQLTELAPPSPQSHFHFKGDEDEETLINSWSKRISKLESRTSMPTADPDDIDELEAVAQEIVAYQLKLKHENGYRNKDIKEQYPRIGKLEERLDVLAGILLPSITAAEEEVEPSSKGLEDLRDYERRLTAKLAKHFREYQGLSPSANKECEQLLKEIAEIKAQLHSQGYTEHEQYRDERVLMKMLRLAELRQFRHRDNKRERKEKQELNAIREEVYDLERKLDDQKRKLHDEQGLSHSDIKGHSLVLELEERLTTLRQMSAGGA